MSLDAPAIQSVRRRLLRWYDAKQRDLPWRHSRDPYAIWISEVMLQQTRVETVRVRWPAFLKRFPSVQALARARSQSVLKAWEGLGYYARARNLHKAAKAIAARPDAQLPASLEGLRALPGFGPYTSAAVASIAFGVPASVVDGNVIRVLTRWQADGGDITKAATKARIADLAERLLAPRRAGDWNQAVMELGAIVCTPRRPSCAACPLRKDCRARAEGDVLAYPVRPPRAKSPHYDIAAGLVWHGSQILIQKRPEDGLLGGLFEFPGGKVKAGESTSDACRRELREETGLEVEGIAPFLQIEHAYTHFRITLHLFHCRVPRSKSFPVSAATDDSSNGRPWTGTRFLGPTDGRWIIWWR